MIMTKRQGCFRYIPIVFLFISVSVLANNHTLMNKLNYEVARQRKANNIPALAVSISFPNHYILNLHSGSQRRGGGAPLDEYSLFQVGSITKTFIAVLILKLASEHKVSLDAPITKYLPQYKKWKNITVRNLLNHTSGIFNYTKLGSFDHIYNDKHNHTQWEPQQIVRYAYKRSLLFKPGKDWRYSNTNYILLGMIIHRVTHRPVAENLQTYILTPYHLKHMYYATHRYPNWMKRHLVHGYYDKVDKTNINMSWAGAAGALVSNSQDMAYWGRQLFTGGVLTPHELRELKKVVSPATGKPLPSYSNEFGYGLGIKRRYFEQYGDIWYHTGTTTGYSALYIWVPNRNMAVAVLTNKGELKYAARMRIALSMLRIIQKYGG